MKAPVHDDFKGRALVHTLDSLPSPQKPIMLPPKILESLEEGIVSISLDGELTYANSRFSILMQTSPEDLLGQPWRSLVASGMDDAFANLKPFQLGKCAKLESRFRRKDGSEIPVYLSLTTIEIGDKSQYLAVVVDLTDMRRAEAVHKVGEDQLRQSQKMEAIGRLASGVAHDFNNFLTAINGFSAFLLDELEKDKSEGGMTEKEGRLRSGLLEISRAGERAAGLTRQLLAFGRKQVQALQAVDVNTVVAEMHRMLGRLIGEDVELSLHLHPKVGTVNFNPGHLEQIILNLSLNARDAMPNGGRLIIETLMVRLDSDFRELPADTAVADSGNPAKPFVLLRFGDNGIGMDDEVKLHLFEPFFTTKKRGCGTGLGLSTVYGIVKQGGGHVDIQSVKGTGSTFLVYLPASETAGKKPRKFPEISWPAQLRGKETILLAEDEYSVRKMTRELLAGNGYTVLEASDGLEALSVLGQFPGTVHLLLTDVVMPHMGGRQLADEVARLSPETRVLYISGYTGDAIVQHGVLEQDRAFLPKPFTPLGLAQKVRQQLDAKLDAVPGLPEAKGS